MIDLARPPTALWAKKPVTAPGPQAAGRKGGDSERTQT